MSAITSRPRISGIVITAAAGALFTGASIAAGLLRACGSVARAAHRELTAAQPSGNAEVRPLCAIRQDQHAAPVRVPQSLSPVKAVKIEAAARIADYVFSDVGHLAAPLKELESAATVRQARAARDNLIAAAEGEHHRAFTGHLVAACTRASLSAGFNTIETHTKADGELRVVATNEAGQALVTEIHAAPDREPSVATEVVGLHDGTCNEILDAFDAALEAEGVRAVAPKRTFTGGVCELAAARAFIRRKLRPKKATKATPSSQQQAHRQLGRVRRQQQR